MANHCFTATLCVSQWVCQTYDRLDAHPVTQPTPHQTSKHTKFSLKTARTASKDTKFHEHLDWSAVPQSQGLQHSQNISMQVGNNCSQKNSLSRWLHKLKAKYQHNNNLCQTNPCWTNRKQENRFLDLWPNDIFWHCALPHYDRCNAEIYH